jgi:hypothetical protein
LKGGGIAGISGDLPMIHPKNLNPLMKPKSRILPALLTLTACASFVAETAKADNYTLPAIDLTTTLAVTARLSGHIFAADYYLGGADLPGSSSFTDQFSGAGKHFVRLKTNPN